MPEIEDQGDLDGFEARVSALLAGSGPTCALSGQAVIAGARRRRTRNRVTGAGASVAVLGVAAAAVALAGGGPTRAQGVAGGPAPAATTSTAPAGAEVCRAGLPATHRDLEVGGQWTEYARGTTAGTPWALQIRATDDGRQARNVVGSTLGPATAPDVVHGPAVQFRFADGPTDAGDVEPLAADPSVGGTGGFGVPYAVRGPIAVFWGVIPRNVDHYCFQYPGRTETVGTITVNGGTFVSYAFPVSAVPDKMYAYDRAGKTIEVRDNHRGVPLVNPDPGGPVAEQGAPTP